MQSCTEGHPPIQHDEFHCPLCAALEDYDGLQDGLNFAEDTIAGLREHIDTLDLADVLHAQAAENAAEQRATIAEQRLRSFVYTVECVIRRRVPMGERLKAIAKVLSA